MNKYCEVRVVRMIRFSKNNVCIYFIWEKLQYRIDVSFKTKFRNLKLAKIYDLPQCSSHKIYVRGPPLPLFSVFSFRNISLLLKYY